jgi:hypothetical protein
LGASRAFRASDRRRRAGKEDDRAAVLSAVNEYQRDCDSANYWNHSAEPVVWIRTPRTLADEKVWYRANRFGGCAFLVSSIVYFAVAKMFPAPKPTSSDHTLWALHLCAFLLPLAASVIFAAKYAKA